MLITYCQDTDMDKDRLLGIVEGFGETPIFVVGDVGLDEYTDGEVSRISPEAPVPVLNPTRHWEKLGLAGNVAENVISLGGSASLFSVVGDDCTGRKIHDLCEAKGITTYLEKDEDRESTLKHRIVSGHHHFIRIDQESTQNICVQSSLDLLHAFEYSMIGEEQKRPIVIIQDYGKGVITPTVFASIADKCKRLGLKLLVDPCMKRLAQYYTNAFLLTPNEREACALVGKHAIADSFDLDHVGSMIIQKAQASHCVITRGSKGMAVFEADVLHSVKIPTFAKDVYDVSGAGDTVIATLALALSSGATVREASIIANVCAGIAVGKVGTAVVRQDELKASLMALRDFL